MSEETDTIKDSSGELTGEQRRLAVHPGARLSTLAFMAADEDTCDSGC